jgi:heme A synthase
MANQQSFWPRIIESVNKPLGFYTLALLIMEGFLAIVLVASDLKPDYKYYGMWIGVGMFLLVVSIVSVCVWFKPKNIMFDQFGHLIDSRNAYIRKHVN